MTEIKCKRAKSSDPIIIFFRIEKLQEICPHYDNSIPPTDVYRIEKALKYAIASNGQTFLWTDHLEEKLKEIYDVRGFFLTTAQEKLKPLIDERYLGIIVIRPQ